MRPDLLEQDSEVLLEFLKQPGQRKKEDNTKKEILNAFERVAFQKALQGAKSIHATCDSKCNPADFVMLRGWFRLL